MGTIHDSEEFPTDATPYWDMAKERLVLLNASPGALSAVCQLLAGVYLIYSCDPFSAWKMVSAAWLSINCKENDESLQNYGTFTDMVLDGQLRTAILKLMCRLQPEIEGLDTTPTTRLYPSTTLVVGKSSVLLSRIAKIFKIRASAQENVNILHPGMSVRELDGIQNTISTILTGLEDLYISILHDDQVTGEVTQDRYLQHLIIETEELILRFPLYLYLHSSVLQEYTKKSEREYDAAQSDHLLAVHVKDKLKSMVDRHLEALLEVASLFLNFECGTQVMDIGWLKRRKCFTLGVLLSASRRVLSMDSCLHQHVEKVDAFIPRLVEFLEHDKLCGNESRGMDYYLKSTFGQLKRRVHEKEYTFIPFQT